MKKKNTLALHEQNFTEITSFHANYLLNPRAEMKQIYKSKISLKCNLMQCDPEKLVWFTF